MNTDTTNPNDKVNWTLPSLSFLDDMRRIQRKAMVSQFQPYNCDPTTFHIWLSLYKSYVGVSLQNLADAIDVDISTVSRWLNGSRMPSKLTVRYIHSILTDTERLA